MDLELPANEHSVRYLPVARKQGRTQEGAAGLQPPSNPTKQKLKNRDFVDIMIAYVLRDFPPQPKSATESG